jgi:hypothetical protein
MIVKYGVGKNLKGSGHGIFKGNNPELTLSDRKKDCRGN